ncbi:hypothetical protein M9458_039031, partial [Cirrhinus mrigala]
RFGHGSGVHRVHGGRDGDAGFAGVGRALLRHALQSGSVLHVRQSGGRPDAAAGPAPGALVDAQRGLHRSDLCGELPGGADLHAGIRELLAGDLQQLRGLHPTPRHCLLRARRRRFLLRNES